MKAPVTAGTAAYCWALLAAGVLLAVLRSLLLAVLLLVRRLRRLLRRLLRWLSGLLAVGLALGRGGLGLLAVAHAKQYMPGLRVRLQPLPGARWITCGA